MKKRIIFCLGLFFASSVNAQISMDDTVNYSILKNTPNSSFFGIGVGYDICINGYNMTLAGIGFGGTFCAPKFFINAGAKMHFAEGVADYSGMEPYIFSVYEAENSRDITFDATYFIKTVEKTEDYRITLKTTGNTEYVMYVPAKKQTRYGLDLGYTGGVTYYNFQESTITGVDENSNVLVFDNGVGKSVSSYYRYNVLKLGGSRTRIGNLSINTDAFGKKSSNGISKLYANLLIGFGGAFDDVFKPAGFDPVYTSETIGPYTRYEITSNTKINPVGACIGWYAFGIGKMGIGTGLELGLMPGPSAKITSNLYLDFRVRFQFAKYLN